MTIKYWTDFSKRKNSTKQPTGGTQATVRLKEPCGIASPSFICNGIPDTVKYIEAFGRYYFVSEVTHDGPDIVIDCVSDPMATFKTAIGNYNGFVEYTTSSTSKTLTDPRNKPSTRLAFQSADMTITSNPFSTVGCYIVGVLGNDSSGAGGVVTYYAMTAGELMLLGSELYDANFIQQIIDQFTASQDSLISCIWIPINKDTISGDQGPVHIGRETLQFTTGKKITNRIITRSTGQVTIPYAYGGGAGADMTYLEVGPYTTVSIFLPFVGVVPGDVEIAALTKKCQLNIYIDILTGDIIYRVQYGAAPTAQFNGNIATKMPVSGASYDAVGVASGVLAVIGGVAGLAATIATEGGALPIIGSIGTIAGGAMAGAKSAELHTMISGGNSSAIGAQVGLVPYIATYQYIPTYTDLESVRVEQGLPYFHTATISSLSGYVKCNNAQLAISGFESDRDTINSYLNSGFYYE